MKLNHLPSLCLVIIFRQLPLLDLISIGQVCSRWKFLLHSVTCKISSLTIEIGSFLPVSVIYPSRFEQLDAPLLRNGDGSPMYPELRNVTQNVLHFKNNREATTRFTLSKAQLVADIFQSVTSLRIVNHSVNPETLCPVVHLLNQWHHRLVSLKLQLQIDQYSYRNLSSNPSLRDCSPLFSPINRMPSPLRTLLIDLGDNLDVNCPLPIIAQLEQLHLFTGHSPCLKASMRQYAVPNGSLHQLGVKFYSPGRLIEGMLPHRFTHFVYEHNYDYVHAANLTAFCDTFSSITNVQVDLPDIYARSIIVPLTRLRSLTFLTLRIIFVPKRKLNKPLPSTLSEPPTPLPQLPQVKSIHYILRKLEERSSFSEFIDYCNIPTVFPSVQVIRFTFLHEIVQDEKQLVYDRLIKSCSHLRHVFAKNWLKWEKV